jgi:hypothetical protein
MTNRRIIASAIVGAGLLALVPGGAEAAIQCDGDFQNVNGQPVATPYCREWTLAYVARSYGFRVSIEQIRYSESTKAQVCRAIGYDNRVQEICSAYRPDGGGSRFNR